MMESNEQFYTVNDVMELLGVKKTKACEIIKELKRETVEKGLLSKEYPKGKIPKRLLEERCMLEV